MIPDWDTNRLFVSDRLEGDEPAVFAGSRAVFAGETFEIIQGTNEIWCRDFMPVQLGPGRFCQFRYAPDYLQSLPGNITPPDRCRLPFMVDYRRDALVLEGGNVVASRSRVILTEKVFRDNPDVAPARVHEHLEAVFGVECLFIPTDPYDTVGHADGVVRFVSEDCVLVNAYGGVEPGYGRRLRRLLERKGLRVETLPMFLDEGEGATRGIPSAVGIYLNYLQVGDTVVLPTYERPEDQLAMDQVRRLMPSAKVFQLPCTSLARRGGVLNCVSWTIQNGPPPCTSNSSTARST